MRGASPSAVAEQANSALEPTALRAAAQRQSRWAASEHRMGAMSDLLRPQADLDEQDKTCIREAVAELVGRISRERHILPEAVAGDDVGPVRTHSAARVH